MIRVKYVVTIEGVVEDIKFYNEINGFTVCDMACGEELITAVGCMPYISIGETLKITGKWVTHPDYGDQVKVETYEKKLPQTLDAIEKYLSSGIVKGIGQATAKKIVKKFGEETLNIIQFHPDKLSSVKGISYEKALKISNTFSEQRELMRVVMFLQDFGISATYSAKIYKYFGERTIEEIRNNPYVLSNEIFSIGFKTVDRIAASVGIDPLSKYRVASGIKYVLSQGASNGHTYIPDEKLKGLASRLLEIDLKDINETLITLSLEKSIYIEKHDGVNRVYLSPFYQSEINVCRKMIELAQVSYNGDLSDFEERIKEVQVKEGIILAEKQKEAIRESLISGVMVITGGPGTGKTTIIKSILNLLGENSYKVCLAAPTGRAAKRMSDATGYEAKTIHRLLEIGFRENGEEHIFLKSESNPVEADVIIIDEMSMVDILLMNHLLHAIAVGTRVILVGDVDQLPSVGPGNVLKDIILSSTIKTVKLTEIFRQAQESMIVVNAHRINKGELPYLNKKDKDFFFIPETNSAGLVKTVVDLVSTRLPKRYGYDPMRHIQVLTPTRKGAVGVTNLNIELQKVLNPNDALKCEKTFRDFIFREGDRVMQVKNNYGLRWQKIGGDFSEGEGVFNGDAGIVKLIDNEEQRVEVLFEDDKLVSYDFNILEEIEPAFAITVHKSQGSEFPVVILPLFPGPQVLMTRNLLYTAVTRARDMVIIVGVENTIRQMILNENETLRYSGLSEKLRKVVVGNI